MVVPKFSILTVYVYILAAQDKQTTKSDVKDKADHPYSDSSAGEVFKRQRSRSEAVSRRHLGSRNKGVITLMLASPVTLLTMSIRKGNFTQTKQIIKVIHVVFVTYWLVGN